MQKRWTRHTTGNEHYLGWFLTDRAATIKRSPVSLSSVPSVSNYLVECLNNVCSYVTSVDTRFIATAVPLILEPIIIALSLHTMPTYTQHMLDIRYAI
jgi:hypothetical protein